MEHLFPRKDRRESLASQIGYSLVGTAFLFYGLKRRSLAGGLCSLVGADLISLGLTGHHVHEALGISHFGSRTNNGVIPYQLGIKVETSISVDVGVTNAYEYMRDFQNLPFFMNHLENVRILDDSRSHWTAKGPAGTKIEWDARIINDIPNEMISWTSENNPTVDNAGSVHFEPAAQGKGTLIRVSLQYLPPAGAIGAIVARLFGEEPEIQIKDDLQRLKQVLEARYPLATAPDDISLAARAF